ncbi:hypothetical protein EDD85DRAFT_375785 [Armillaria nabsnona]|nr:hypothetical protein EDD85DRAFT_375785 [Armillaria nabsnona]
MFSKYHQNLPRNCVSRTSWILLSHTIRISVALGQATTQLSVLPIDWEIAAYNPAPNYIHGKYADPNWIIFLEDTTRGIAPATFKCVRTGPFEEVLSHSAYLNCVRRFSGHGVHTETEGDVRGIMHQSSLRKGCSSQKAIQFMDILCGSV